MRVQDVAVKWLCEIAGYVDRSTRHAPVPEGTPGALSAGLPYPDVLDHVRAETGGRCSYAGLRWYAHAIREGWPGFEGHTLPRYRRRTPRRE